jgi:DNA mismatch repair protein MSH6
MNQSTTVLSSVQFTDPKDEWPPKDREYSFLWPENIKDSNGRNRDHPDYDKTTLMVPYSFLSKQSEAQRQWWELKAQYFDTILAFKVGKFYELFRMDAIVGIEELNLLPMGGSRLHSGFPEASFDKYADSLTGKGYRVARVEQTESATARDQRLKDKTGGKQSRVVRREICQIITPGTSRINSMNAADGSGRFLLSIYQSVCKEEGETFNFGVAFVDSTIGLIKIGQFDDDRHCSRLRTLIALFPPKEVLIEKKNFTREAELVIKNSLSSFVHVRRLTPEKQFLSASAALAMIQERNYFTSNDGKAEYPEELMKMLDTSDVMMRTPLSEFQLGIRAFGGLLFYLKECLIDEEIVSLKLIEAYVPPSTSSQKGNDQQDKLVLPSTVVLDDCTLKNLDIFTSDIGSKGSLFALLNHTRTKFGARMLRFWITSPLTSVADIKDRLEAVEDLEFLLNNQPNLFSTFSKLPDMERLVNRIHTQGLKRKNDHPDSRAQMFEDYDKKKMSILIRVMDGLVRILSFLKAVRPYVDEFNSNFLKNLLTSSKEGGSFPDIDIALTTFAQAFDVQEARESGKVFPRDDGTDPEYSSVCQEIRDVEDQFQQVLKRESTFFRTPLKFVHSGKKRYLLEIPSNVFESVKDKKQLSRYKFEGVARKVFKKFSTKELGDLVNQLKEKEEAKEVLLSDHKRRLFAMFSKDLHLWIKAIHQISVIDCLLSLAQCKMSLQAVTDVTKPEFVSDCDPPIIEIKGGKHPVLACKENFNFVPNDVTLKGDELVILTGPNMGGKSTLMRETGLIVLMAQLGSFVPASSVRLTPVDRIFTRLGSSDRIMQGESTFFLEMSETASILRHSTRNSLILLDELGRGTSTFDGTAIAYAVIKGLAQNVKARTFFSTHYHSLVEDVEKEPNIKTAHMESILERKELVFLYRLVDGSCPKSHGFHAARMAGMPEDIVKEAEAVAENLEFTMQRNKCFSRISSSAQPSIQEARKLLRLLRG